MPSGRRLAQLRHHAVVVVEGGVEAELLEPGDLLRRAGAADHLAAAELDQLAHQAADSTGRAGDEDGLAGLQVGDSDEPGPRGEARHAQDAEIRRRGCHGGVDEAEPLGRSDGVAAPAAVVQDGVTDLVGVDGGRHDLADGPALEHLADLERRHVALGVVHPAAHVGVDRHEEVAHQDLALGGFGHLDVDEGEVGQHRLPDGAGGQVDLASFSHGEHRPPMYQATGRRGPQCEPRRACACTHIARTCATMARDPEVTYRWAGPGERTVRGARTTTKTDGRPSVLIVSAAMGAGHDGVAYELEKRLLARGAHAEVVDYLELLPGRMGPFYRSFYQGQLTHAPASTYEWLYGKIDRGVLSYVARYLGQLGRFKVRRMVERGSHDLVLTTYPMSVQALGPCVARASSRCRPSASSPTSTCTACGCTAASTATSRSGRAAPSRRRPGWARPRTPSDRCCRTCSASR